MSLRAQILVLTSDHLEGVAALEQSAGDVHWTLAQIRAELAKPIARYYVAVTAENGVVGYGGGWVLPPEVQVANLVVHPAFRRLGIGRHLLETLLTQARVEGCRHATLEVRRRNRTARALYEGVGFHKTGLRPDVYTCPPDAAVLMEMTW